MPTPRARRRSPGRGPSRSSKLVRVPGLARGKLPDLLTGQNFIVFGGNIWVTAGFHPVGEIHRRLGPWTPEELVAAKAELFKGISSGIPKFSFF